MLQNYQRTVQSLLAASHFPGFSPEELDRFKIEHRTTVFTCRTPLCPRATSGFETQELRDEHEATHSPLFKCTNAGCQYPPFVSFRALKNHQPTCQNLVQRKTRIRKQVRVLDKKSPASAQGTHHALEDVAKILDYSVPLTAQAAQVARFMGSLVDGARVSAAFESEESKTRDLTSTPATHPAHERAIAQYLGAMGVSSGQMTSRPGQSIAKPDNPSSHQQTPRAGPSVAEYRYLPGWNLSNSLSHVREPGSNSPTPNPPGVTPGLPKEAEGQSALALPKPHCDTIGDAKTVPNGPWLNPIAMLSSGPPSKTGLVDKIARDLWGLDAVLPTRFSCIICNEMYISSVQGFAEHHASTHSGPVVTTWRLNFRFPLPPRLTQFLRKGICDCMENHLYDNLEGCISHLFSQHIMTEEWYFGPTESRPCPADLRILLQAVFRNEARLDESVAWEIRSSKTLD